MSERQKLTFISPRFLFPADSGGKIRTTQVLRGLKDGAFELSLLMPSSADTRERYRTEIDSVCDRLLLWEPRDQSNLLKNIKKLMLALHENPIPVMTDWDAEGAARVRQALADMPDAVVFDFPHSVVLAPDSFDVPSILFTHNIEAEIFQRHWQVAGNWLFRHIWHNQYRKMYRFEKAMLSRFDAIVAVSDRDREFFTEEYGVEHCGTIPTGVDVEYFNYAAPAGRQTVVFCGSMDWMPNVDGIEFFFDSVWPRIREHAPEATMKVVGRAPPEALANRIQASAPEWEFTGFVDDVREHICGADVFVIPLRVGGGTRIKAFEAMAMGTPVVSTSIGIEGLPVHDREHFLAADDPVMFADRVLNLLDDARLRTEISTSARRLVEKRYGFRQAARVFEDICLATTARCNAAASGGIAAAAGDRGTGADSP